MHLIYIDESGNTGNNLSDGQQPLLVIGALVVNEDVWCTLETALMARISSFFKTVVPLDFELHGTELRSGRGHFSGIPVNDRIELRDDCLKLAKELNVKFIYRCIEKAKYRVWHDKACGSALTINPYLPAYMLVATVVNSYLETLPGKPRGMFVTDENKEIAKDVEKAVRALRFAENHFRLSRIVEKSIFIESTLSLPLQLCDVCTFWVRRLEEDRLRANATDGDKSAKPLLEAITHRGTETWDVVAWLVEQQQNEKKRPGT